MRIEVERLSAADRASLLQDEFGWPPHIGVVGIIDGSGLFDGAGRFPFGAAREWIAGRLDRAHRLRQVLFDPPFGLGGPLWVDARSFDIAEHVTLHPLRYPADEADLLAEFEEFRRLDLERSRPLWHLWLLPGLAGGRVGMFVKLHHAVADGVAGIDILCHLLGSEPNEPSLRVRWTPRPGPTRMQLLADSLRRRGRLGHPHRRGGWAPMREMFRGRPLAPTSLNQPIGPRRRLAFVRTHLVAVHDAAHRGDGTVNDAVLAAVAGGLGDLLRSRGDDVAGRTITAFVPMSMRPGSSPPAGGNHHGPMMLPLPIGERDAWPRLRLIAAESRRRKLEPRPHWGTGLSGLPFVQRLALRYAKNQHRVGVYVADIPGPVAPLYLAGAQVLELFPVVPLSGNLPLGIGVLSYCGQLNVAVVADPDAVPDLDVFVASVTQALHSLAGGVELSAEGAW